MSLSQRIISRLPRSWTEQCAELLRSSPLLKRSYDGLTSSFKNRDGVIASGPSRGLRFNAGQSDSRFLLGTFEPALQEILASHLRSNMTFYDVGANVGFLAVLAARLVGNSGQVHCFEPLPANVEQIRHNVELNGFSQIVAHQVALAQTDSTATFRVSERPTFGALSDSPMSVDKQIATIDVSVRRLDSLFEQAGLAGPDVIKIDIEGSEVDFFSGAEQVIRRFRPVLLIELHGTNDAVAGWLGKLSYDCAIVGGGTIERAGWAALCIATPLEQPQTRAAMKAICEKFAGR
jgi:FkbM family methyltransferase